MANEEQLGLTQEQLARLPAWREEWVGKGLCTDEADWETFDVYMPKAYDLAGLEYPSVTLRVESPAVGAVIAAVAHSILRHDPFLELCDKIARRNKAGDLDSTPFHSRILDVVRPELESKLAEQMTHFLVSVMSGLEDLLYQAFVRQAEDFKASLDAVLFPALPAEDEELLTKVLKTIMTPALPWHNWLGGQFWVGGWWGSPAYVAFFTDVYEFPLPDDLIDRVKINRSICESVNFIWCNAAFVIVCNRPSSIRLDGDRLHYDQGQAITYRDGWGLFMLDGIAFEEDLYWAVVRQEATLDRLMTIENADQRAVALKYCPAAMVRSGAHLIDASERGNSLYLIEGGDVNATLAEDQIWILHMHCPTGREFYEGVDPEFAATHRKADACQAHLLADLSLDEYQALKKEG